MGIFALVLGVSTLVCHRACHTIGRMGHVYLFRFVFFFALTQKSASRPLLSLDQSKLLAIYLLAMCGVFNNAQKLRIYSHLFQYIVFNQHFKTILSASSTERFKLCYLNVLSFSLIVSLSDKTFLYRS